MKKHSAKKCVYFQISRASFLQLYQYRMGKIEGIVDTLEREDKMDKFTTEKMEFYNAVEEGDIVLGDSLLHLAVRRGHLEIIYFLLEQLVREDIPNFKGQLVIDCCLTTSLEVVIQDVQAAHAVMGFDFDEIKKVFQLLRSLRRIWPVWMFDSDDSNQLLRAIYSARTNHPRYNALLRIVQEAAERYHVRFSIYCINIAAKILRTCDGQAHKAKKQFSTWEKDQKLDLIFDAFRTIFADWQHRPNDTDQDAIYLAYVDYTFESWVNIAEEYRLHRDESVELDAHALDKYSTQLCAKRLHPRSSEVSSICAHIVGLEKYLKLRDLAAEN